MGRHAGMRCAPPTHHCSHGLTGVCFWHGADGNLETVVEGPELAVHQPEEVLAGMNEWCVEQHGKSGLTKVGGWREG